MSLKSSILSSNFTVSFKILFFGKQYPGKLQKYIDSGKCSYQLFLYNNTEAALEGDSGGGNLPNGKLNGEPLNLLGHYIH